MGDIMSLDVESISADDSLLFMWVTGPKLGEGCIDIMEFWGFKYATVAFVWDKVTPNPGFYTISQCEFVLVGRRGRIPKPRGARNVRQLLTDFREDHSTKPQIIRERIEEMFPEQSKVELFARQPHPGWTSWGNEV